MNKLSLILILFSVLGNRVQAQEFMPLWPNGEMPNSLGMDIIDSSANELMYRVGTPGIYLFFPSAQQNKGAAVIICPGGGFERLSYGTHWQLAKWFNTMGISAFVLNYRLPTSPDLEKRELGPLQDAQRAFQLVRGNAKKWGIDPERIGVQGSSAGGHVAASLSTVITNYASIGDSISQQPICPAFTILVSPVITMGTFTHAASKKKLLGENPSSELIKTYSLENRVTTATPPCFIVHAFNDTVVDQRNSLLFHQALINKNISSSLHIFPQGGHAISLRNNPGTAQNWVSLCENWLIEMNFIANIK